MQHDFILLDRSGSMEDKWDETLSSLNTYVHDLAKQNVDTGVTLITFDDHGGATFDVIRDRIIPSTWKDVTTTEIQARGGTPLNDSIAKMVTRAKEGFNGVQYDKVAMIILTDGMENASKEFPGEAGRLKVEAMLDELRAKNWQIIFIGCDFDNTVQATSLGNAANQTVNMTIGNMKTAMASTSAKRGLYGATGQSVNYTEEEKDQFSK
jgi:hypothetical protein